MNTILCLTKAVLCFGAVATCKLHPLQGELRGTLLYEGKGFYVVDFTRSKHPKSDMSKVRVPKSYCVKDEAK